MSEYDQVFKDLNTMTDDTVVEPAKSVDELITAPTKTVEELTQEITVLQQKLNDETRRLDYWKQRFSSAQGDWDILSERLTSEANDRDWCAEYDTIINELNDSFTVFELAQRVQSYEVSVTLTATYYTTVTVEATTIEDAQEKVEAMDCDDIDNNSGMSWRHPDDAEFEVTDVESS